MVGVEAEAERGESMREKCRANNFLFFKIFLQFFFLRKDAFKEGDETELDGDERGLRGRGIGGSEAEFGQEGLL